MSAPRLLVVQVCDEDGPGRLGDWLRDAGLELDVVRVDNGEPVPGLDGYDGLLMLGGHQAAYDPPEVSPELVGVRELLRAAVRRQVPTVAVCLGGQLLAQALGGTVRVAVDGPELGAHLVAKKDVAAADPLFSTVPFTPDVIQWHYDEIALLPAGAVLLASSPRYANQAFRVGSCAWGVQFHIETTPEMVAIWAAGDHGRAADWGLDVDVALARAVAVHDDVAEVWTPVAQRFADIVRAFAETGQAPSAAAVPSPAHW
ncbi:MAG: type 1 glutamine amidotransferase [Geodermatophilaceae bacterium]|nr:type 1 glutamine amidotransferase [Geodermatophilaceae bacterium]